MKKEYNFSKGFRGKFYRPNKVQKTIRIDKDILEFYTEVPTLSLPSKPSTHQITGTVASAVRRPDLVIAE